MKFKVLILFFLLLFSNLIYGQIWRYPHDIFPYGAVGMNTEMKDLKRLKTKTYSTIKYGDSLSAYYEYDTKGRLLRKKDEYSNDTIRYGYDNLNEWEYIFNQNDTVVRRYFEFESKGQIKKITTEYTDNIFVFRVDRIDDTLIRTFKNNQQFEEIHLDNKCRTKKVIKIEDDFRTEIRFNYSKDTVSYIVLYNEKISEYTFGVYKKGKLILIDSKEKLEGLNHRRIKITYTKRGQNFETYSAFKDEKGQFDYYLIEKYEYDKRKRQIKGTYYSREGIAFESFINYTYY